jgi:hypothetical protein
MMPKYSQKFQRGQRVKITDKMPSYMAHFESNCEAIVKYTYKEKYGGGKTAAKEYSLYILTKPGTKMIDLESGKISYNLSGYSVSWYEENQLTLIDVDTKAGLDILGKAEK